MRVYDKANDTTYDVFLIDNSNKTVTVGFKNSPQHGKKVLKIDNPNLFWQPDILSKFVAEIMTENE